MPKPAVHKVDPRTVARGMVVWSKDSKRDEVVRDVSVVLHLANGWDEVYSVGEELEVLSEQPVAVVPEKHRDVPELEDE